MRGAPLRIDPHESQVSQLSFDEATAKIASRRDDAEFVKRFDAGDAAEVYEMKALHRAKTVRQAGGLDWDGSGGGVGKSGAAGWTEAVTKLIPAEVVAAYLAGKLVIPTTKTSYLLWTLACLGLVVWSRWSMTSDKDATPKVPAEGPAVFISAVSFVVWVYSLGDLFKMYGYWSAENSTHVLIAWTIVSPVVLLVLKRGRKGLGRLKRLLSGGSH